MNANDAHETRRIVVTDPDVPVLRPVAVEVYDNWAQMHTSHFNFEEAGDLIVQLAAFLRKNGQHVPDISE